MELTISTPALLFSTVSLLMIAFTNRFLAIASLIRDLHEKFRTKPDTVYVAQIQNLHRRLLIIRNIQISSVISLLLSAICMLVIFQGNQTSARWLFGSALLMQILALILSVFEISISINALKIELSDMEKELGRRSFEFFNLRSRHAGHGPTRTPE
ncbi:DUF2721 domain-containing protein [Nibrella saemangeumensis]|uniref:DUF2721 domain-containing protein n=1 Tax=Nibrella saemangeumensis TaxID=1084526 RepID=A0ABP8NDW3_9BACT